MGLVEKTSGKCTPIKSITQCNCMTSRYMFFVGRSLNGKKESKQMGDGVYKVCIVNEGKGSLNSLV